MKKDTFNLKQYLVENKMTTNSRGDVRHHFGELKLDTRILKEGYAGPDDHGMSEFEDWYDAHIDEFDSEDEAWAFWEENIAGKQSGIDLSDPDLDECGDVPNMTLDDQIAEEFDEMEKGLDEAGYTDDEEDYDLSDFNYDIPEDPRAAKAAQKDIAGDTADVDADIEDEPADAPLDGDEEDEPAVDEPAVEEPAAGAEITVNDLVPGEGAKVEEMRNNIDILTDLNEFFAEHPTWRIGTLQRDIRTGFREIKEFGYKNLYLTPTMQGYDKRTHNTTGRAIIRLRRPESVSQYGDTLAQ